MMRSRTLVCVIVLNAALAAQAQIEAVWLTHRSVRSSSVYTWKARRWAFICSSVSLGCGRSPM